MTEKQMELLLAFMAKEVLTDVDPALRRAVFALYKAYMEQAQELR